MINDLVASQDGRKHTLTKIKTCGLRREEDIEYANRLKPNYIGFILCPRFPKRYVEPAKALELKKKLDPRIKAVGVFVDQDADEIAEIAASGAIDMIQLHGSEDEAYIEALKKQTGKPIIKAFKIRSREDVETALKSPADYILLDNGTGTGEKFDWSLLEGMRAEIKRPFFLAGGLDPGNAAEAVRAVRPFAVDVSSGIEQDGAKSYFLMKEFINEVRSL
ncbi:MAG: phosphoribosylanthranilate isomerase [Eubacteriales bacterium]|nr:phosphoribosylanthranilate isomerase [Eubacteriales bacterium]